MVASGTGGVYLERYGQSSFLRLREIVSTLKRDDPLAPVTVVVPTRYAAVAVRRALASERGIANVQFRTMSDLAGVLGKREAAEGGRSKLTRHLEAAAIRATADGVHSQSPLSEIKDHPKLQASLRNTFRDLERRGERILRGIELLDEFRSETVRWFRRYRELTADCNGDERLAVEAARAVTSGVSKAFLETGHLILYLVSALSPGEALLAEALYRAGRCTSIAGLLGDDAADAAPLDLAKRLCPDGTANVLADREGGPMTNALIVSAPDAAEEVRSAIRSVMAKAREGVPFHKSAVLYGQAEPYAQLIASQLELAGIPAAGPVRRRLSDTPPGKLLDLLLKAVEDGLSRSAVLRWVAEAPVRDPHTGAAAYDQLLLWERISADAGIVGGRGQWLDRLDTYRRGEKARIDSYVDFDEVPPGTIARHRRLFEAADRLRAFVETLADDADLLSSSGFRESADWCKSQLEKYAHDADSWPQSGHDALSVLNKDLDEIAELGTRFPEFGADDFAFHLREAFGTGVGSLGPLGTGVFVGPLDAAQGMAFDLVHVVGVAEGGFPRRPADDPILPERLLGNLGDEGTLGRAAEREAQDRRSYLCALSAGRSVVLSYPRAEPGGQREQYPSPWLLEAARDLYGAPVSSDELTRLSGEPWLTVIESVQHGLDLAGKSRAADEHDYDLASLHEWRKTRRGLRGHFLADEEPLGRALYMEGQRLSGRFTAWDGDVSAVAGVSRRLSRQREGVLSPTGLERWATCPYRYFLGDVLRISALDAPADELSISPLDKGSLVHRILEQFMRESMESGDVPAPGKAWSAGRGKRMREIAEREFEAAERAGKSGRRLLWRVAKQEILEDLDRFLLEDERWRSGGWTTMAVEQRFGAPNRDQLQAAKVELPGGPVVTFRGMIDRVDVSEDGETAIVIDYKTGGTSAFRDMNKDPLDRGRRLQLPVYAAAVRATPGIPDGASGFFWFVTSRGRFEKVEVDLDEDALKERFESVVAIVSSGIAAGTFPARPGAGDRGNWRNCRFCDFDRICPSNRLRLWEGKKRDGALAQYTELAEDVGEE